jgi:hypothetical protein
MPNFCLSSRVRNGWWTSASNSRRRTKPFGTASQAGSIRSSHQALRARCRSLSLSARSSAQRRYSVERGCQVASGPIREDMPRCFHNAQFDLSSFQRVDMIVDAWRQQPIGRRAAHEMFAWLRRWINRALRRVDIAPEMTVRCMGVGHVRPLDGLRRRRSLPWSDTRWRRLFLDCGTLRSCLAFARRGPGPSKAIEILISLESTKKLRIVFHTKGTFKSAVAARLATRVLS